MASLSNKNYDNLQFSIKSAIFQNEVIIRNKILLISFSNGYHFIVLGAKISIFVFKILFEAPFGRVLWVITIFEPWSGIKEHLQVTLNFIN